MTKFNTKDIQNAASDAVRAISDAALKATTVIAQAAETAAKVVANNAEIQAKIAATPSAQSVSDHDLIVKLDTKVDALKDDIKLLNDGANTRQLDHEVRIKSLESTTTKLYAYGASLVFAAGVIQFFLAKFWK